MKLKGAMLNVYVQRVSLAISVLMVQIYIVKCYFLAIGILIKE